MFAHAIAQVEPDAVGIHLIWAGPKEWIYSLKGWSIQRRKYHKADIKKICDSLDASRLTTIKNIREIRLSFGTVTLRDGLWPIDIRSIFKKDISQATACDVFTLVLDEPRSSISVEVKAEKSFVYGISEGKVVSSGGAPIPGKAKYELNATRLDSIKLYVLASEHITFCIHLPADEKNWSQEPYIVKELQLPLRELNPLLSNWDQEYAECQARLLPGESLDKDEFKRLADMLRLGVCQVNPPRPIDQILLVRREIDTDFEETSALNLLRVFLVHPKWRRVLGFSWFDNDPTLIPGETYEYRITGSFPARDLNDKVYSFHNTPSKTALPRVFYIDGLRVCIPTRGIVELTPGTLNSEKINITRRGLRINPKGQYLGPMPGLDDWGIIIDFPNPVTSIILELQEGHSLEYAGCSRLGNLSSNDMVPSGLYPQLNFPKPIEQLRLKGTAFLYAIRIPSETNLTGLVPISVVLQPIKLVDTPRPDPPVTASISNLQQPQVIPDDKLPLPAQTRRPAIGFNVRWLPSVVDGLNVWPLDEDVAPPLDASIFQIECRQMPDGRWKPIISEENWLLGGRNNTEPNTRIHYGADLAHLGPKMSLRSKETGVEMHWEDVFDFSEGGNEVYRPVPPLGTYHQYKIRTIDSIGRPSLTWTITKSLRLEKHQPPPVPVGPDETITDDQKLPTPIGVQAKVLVKGALDLTAEERSILGQDNNAIILRWGWHKQQREQDPLAKEFRVYVANNPLDSIRGTIISTAQTGIPGKYKVRIKLSCSVDKDAAKGNTLMAGYHYYISTHTGGKTINAILESQVPGPSGSFLQPVLGPVTLPLSLSSSMTRPPAWSERIEEIPITDDEEYTSVIRNRLNLTQSHPQDVLWIGVSSADDQTYVPDQLAPREDRCGNESAIVPVICDGKYWERPILDDNPPTLDPVPVLLSPEPAGAPIYFRLDLTPYLGFTGLISDDLIKPERASVDTVFESYYIAPGDRIMARSIDKHSDSDADHEVNVPNPIDRATLIAQLNGSRTDTLEARFAIFLAGSHPYRDHFFNPATQDPVHFGPFEETLPSQTGRYIYRVRKSDASGHLSEGSAIAKVIVRVPSLSPGGAPERNLNIGDAPGIFNLRVAPDIELTHVLIFKTVIAGSSDSAGEAVIMRIPNRPDLYPDRCVFLRLPNGSILTPQIKALSDSDVIIGDDGFRHITLNFNAGAGERIRIWTCTLTRDGIPSAIGGPWSLAMPVPDLPSPSLMVSGNASELTFKWLWPPTTSTSSTSYNVALERSSDGESWVRVSPLLPEAAIDYKHRQYPGSWQYRLRVMSPDGRSAFSNIVVV